MARYAAVLLMLLLTPVFAQLDKAQRIDNFAAIALQTPPPQRPHLQENPPPVLPPIELEASQNNPALDFPPRHMMRTDQEFRARVLETRAKLETTLRACKLI